MVGGMVQSDPQLTPFTQAVRRCTEKCCSAEHRGNKEASSFLQTHPPLPLPRVAVLSRRFREGQSEHWLCNPSAMLFFPASVLEGKREGGGSHSANPLLLPRPPSVPPRVVYPAKKKKKRSGGCGHKDSSMLC